MLSAGTKHSKTLTLPELQNLADTRLAQKLSQVAGVGLVTLSGGQRRRVAIARAMAAKPRILLYDEPTTGLDPITALTVDEEIIKLRDLEGVSSILVTHQLRDAFFVAQHTAARNGGGVSFERAEGHKADEAEFIMLREGRIAFEGTADDFRAAAETDPYILAFLS